MTAARPMTEDDRMQLVRYTRPERWPLLDRFPVSSDLHGSILAGILAEEVPVTLNRLKGLRTRALDTVSEMLTDPDYRDALNRLPFRAGDRIAALGDSLTADRLGWFDLLVESMQRNGSHDVVTLNLGLSGDTTADAIERFDLLEAFRPTHVLIMLGTNDARRHGLLDTHRMVSPAETRRNLAALADLVTDTLHAQAVFITPPRADQSRIAKHFAGSSVCWVADEVDAVADIVRDVARDCIDIHRTLGPFGTATVLDPDGVHLSAAGQRLVAVAVATTLAASNRSAPADAPRSGSRS